MPTCKSCGASILWAKTAGGKLMPVDVEPDAARGNVLVVDGKAEVLAGDKLSDAFLARIQLHTSHFATCPGAAAHRKPKGGG